MGLERTLLCRGGSFLTNGSGTRSETSWVGDNWFGLSVACWVRGSCDIGLTSPISWFLEAAKS